MATKVIEIHVCDRCGSEHRDPAPGDLIPAALVAAGVTYLNLAETCEQCRAELGRMAYRLADEYLASLPQAQPAKRRRTRRDNGGTDASHATAEPAAPESSSPLPVVRSVGAALSAGEPVILSLDKSTENAAATAEYPTSGIVQPEDHKIIESQVVPAATDGGGDAPGAAECPECGAALSTSGDCPECGWMPADPSTTVRQLSLLEE